MNKEILYAGIIVLVILIVWQEVEGYLFSRAVSQAKNPESDLLPDQVGVGGYFDDFPILDGPIEVTEIILPDPPALEPEPITEVIDVEYQELESRELIGNKELKAQLSKSMTPGKILGVNIGLNSGLLLTKEVLT